MFPLGMDGLIYLGSGLLGLVQFLKNRAAIFAYFVNKLARASSRANKDIHNSESIHLTHKQKWCSFFSLRYKSLLMSAWQNKQSLSLFLVLHTDYRQKVEQQIVSFFSFFDMNQLINIIRLSLSVLRISLPPEHR